MLANTSVLRGPAWLGQTARVLSGLAALVLTACGGPSYVNKDPLTAQKAAQDGTVIVSVTLNTGQASQFDLIRLQRAGEKNGPTAGDYVLSNALPGLSRDTALFVGLLPAGDYRVLLLVDNNTQKFFSVSETQNLVLGRFRVTAGKTHDLGRLVVTAANFNVLIGRSSLIASNRELVSRFAPRYLPLMQAPLPGWTTTPDTERDVAERFALLHPQGLGGLSELANGDVVAGTRAGTIVRRGADGRWRVIGRTGRLDAILWTVPHEVGDQLLVAAGELGTLLSLDRHGAIRPIAPGNLPAGNYFFVDRSSDGKAWIVGVQTPGDASLYRSASLDNGNWQKLRGDTTEFSYWSGQRNVWVWSRPGGIGFASSKSAKIACYDYASGRWQESSMPNDRTPISISVSPNNVVGLLSSPGGGFGGVFAKTHYSRDCGRQWVEVDTPFSAQLLPPVMLPSGEMLVTGGAFSKGSYGSRDGGKTWTKYADDISFSDVVWSMPKSGLIGVSRGDFGVENVRHSSDGGRSWKTELSSIDFKLLELQDKRKQ